VASPEKKVCFFFLVAGDEKKPEGKKKTGACGEGKRGGGKELKIHIKKKKIGQQSNRETEGEKAKLGKRKTLGGRRQRSRRQVKKKLGGSRHKGKRCSGPDITDEKPYVSVSPQEGKKSGGRGCQE